MTFKNLVAALSTIAVFAAAASAQTDLASCDFVFTPGAPVDPATTNLVADFNFISGREMLVVVPSHEGFIQGATFTENPDDVFNVHNEFSAVGWTCSQVSDFQEGLAGQTFPGPSGISWTIQSAECTCAN